MTPCATSNVPTELVAALTANGCTEVFFGHSALEYPAAMMGGVTGMDDTDALFADALVSMIREMSDDELHNVAEIVRQVQIERAVGNGDEDAIIANAFEMAFGRDGLAVLPWVEGNVVVCPGGMVSKSKASHKCRFVSVDDTWIWESHLLLREDKRSSPGTDEGFRAVALAATRRRHRDRRRLGQGPPGPTFGRPRRQLRDPRRRTRRGLTAHRSTTPLTTTDGEASKR